MRKLSPAIGAEIDDVDLSRPLSRQQLDDLRVALLKNLVLFFRDQT